MKNSVPPGSTELSIDADEDLPRLQDKVYIYREEDTERVFTETTQLYNLHLEAWRLRDRDRVFSRETRFADEDPQPVFPKMIFSPAIHQPATIQHHAKRPTCTSFGRPSGANTLWDSVHSESQRSPSHLRQSNRT